MGWENARPDRPPPAPRGAHFPTPWPLWRCVSWRGWRGVWWRVFWGWLGVIQGLFGVELALFWRGDIWPFTLGKPFTLGNPPGFHPPELRIR